MPPKRKRDSEPAAEATSSRGTRSSTRLSGGSVPDATVSDPAPAKKTSTRKKTAPKEAEAPAPKKAKTAKALDKAPAKPKKSKKTVDNSDDGGENSSLTTDDAPAQPRKSTPTPPIPEPPLPKTLSLLPTTELKPAAHAPPPAAKSQASIPKVEPYAPDRAASLFKKYADEDDPNVIGPEGFERLCTDSQISLEGALPLILAWQLNAKEMAKLTKEEWTKGTQALQVSSLPSLSMLVSDLEQLLIKGKPPAKSSGSKKDPYDKTVYAKYAADPKAAFQSLYSFCFTLAKPEQSRNLEMETTAALWSVLLVPKFPIMSDILEFISEKEGTYKATNKDLWGMMLEFCTTVKPSLQDYEADGAWPTLLDDFVEWKKAKLTNGNGTAE